MPWTNGSEDGCVTAGMTTCDLLRRSPQFYEGGMVLQYLALQQPWEWWHENCLKSPKTHYDSRSFADFHLLRNEKKRCFRQLAINAGAYTEHTCLSSHIATVHRKHLLILTHRYCTQAPAHNTLNCLSSHITTVHRRPQWTHLLIFAHRSCAQNTLAYLHTSLLCTGACTKHTLLIFTHHCRAQDRNE